MPVKADLPKPVGDRKWRDDRAQALLLPFDVRRFAGVAAGANSRSAIKLSQLLSQRLDLALQDFKALRRRVEHFAAGRAIRHEVLGIGFSLDQSRARFLADHRRTRRNIVGHDRRRANTRTFADGDRPQYLGTRADDHIVQDRRMAFPARAVGRVGATQSDILVHGDVIANLGSLADDAEAVIEEEIAARSSRRDGCRCPSRNAQNG